MSRFRKLSLTLGVFVFLFSLSACPEQSPEGLDASATQDASATADVQNDVDAGEQCNNASECAAGQGCHEGICAACQSADDCRADLHEACNGGVCGPCTDANQCAEGLACRLATGECKSCRSSQECRSGEGCVEGVCGTCTEAIDCAGALCTNGTCVGCVPGDDDDTCQTLFDDSGMYCRDDGRCGPSLCASGLDCVILQEVCDSSSSRCRACNNSSECLDDNAGGYAAGTICVDGACLEANCADSSTCPQDRPVCGSDHRCRTCQIDQECLDREDVTTGFVCDLERGRCAAGDCYPAAEACGEAVAGQICDDDFVCAACANNSQCDQAYSSNHLCMDGQCEVAECNLELPCADERICDDGSCVDCTSNNQSYCLTRSMVCDDSQHACIPCSTSPECGADYICVSGSCFVGQCAIPNEINPFNPCQYCDGATHLWADKPQGTGCGTCQICSDLPDEGGITCQFVLAGDDPRNDCTQNCEVCDGFGACQWAFSDTDPNDNCQASSLASCGFDGLCQGGSNKCSYWDAADGVVDDGNECTTDDHCDGQGGITGSNVNDGSTCLSGTKICKTGICSDCINSTECTGVDQVCSSGNCVAGNCSSPADCHGEVPQCNTWTCDGNNTCQPSPVSNGSSCDTNPCTTNDQCLNGLCAEASTPNYVTCAQDTNCSLNEDLLCNEVICVPAEGQRTWTYAPEVVNGESCQDTGTRVCLSGYCDGAGSCSDDVVANGYCFIEDVCRASGDSITADACTLSCDPGKPRSWTVADNNCYIDEYCIPAGDDNPSNQCKYCGTSDTTWSNYRPSHACTDSEICEPVCSSGTCKSRWQPYSKCLTLNSRDYNCASDLVDAISWLLTAGRDCPSAPTAVSASSADDTCALLPSNHFTNWRLPTSAEIQAIISSEPNNCLANSCPQTIDKVQTSSLFKNQIFMKTYYWAKNDKKFKRVKFTDATTTYVEPTPPVGAKAIGWCVKTGLK